MTKCAELSPEYISLKLQLLDIKQTELAYMAGIFDGEGNLSFRVMPRKAGNKCLSAGMTIANTNTSVLKWCRDKFGGDLYGQSGKNKYAVFTWQLRKRESVNFLLTAIMPFLIIKRPEAEIYCRGLRLITSNNGTNKGVDRHHCSIRKPDGYWEPLEQIEKELRQAKNDYKHLASGDLHSCIN
jgi:hypothetical protein